MQFEVTNEFLESLRAGIRRKDKDFVLAQVHDLFPVDIAHILNDLEPAEAKDVFELLDEQTAADVTFELDEVVRETLFETLTSKEIAEDIIENLESDEAADLIAELPDKQQDEVLQHLEDEEQASDIADLLSYDENTAGGLMMKELVMVRDTLTMRECVRQLREHADHIEEIYAVYVVDDAERLLGYIPLKKILTTNLRTPIKDVYESDIITVKVNMDREEVAKTMERYDLIFVPVVDTLGRLAGRITIDDVVDVIRKEETEDVQKMGGMEALEDSYMGSSTWEMIRKRAGWLIILFIGESFTATAMSFFEDQIAKAVVLALFVPLIISSGGNTGSQASTLVIRALALGEVSIREWWKIFVKEIKVGVTLGIILGVFGFLRVAVWSNFVDIYGPHWLEVAYTVGFSLLGVVIWGNLVGSLFPMLLKRSGFDPAVSSTPFVATLVDITGLVLYFSIASLILGGLLL
ncbi:MAG: magnesium transporter [Bacteroidia bacterium]|nr:magnesium transporter [Bacteroidia bacterium]